MPLFLRTSILGVYVVALWGLALAFPGSQKRNQNSEEGEVCYDTDVLWSFDYWRRDSEPYCSSLLSISDVVSTLPPVTSLTTTSTVITTEYDSSETVTIPQATVVASITSTIPLVYKRDVAPAATASDTATPALSFINSAGTNASIAAYVYSACSCLRLTRSTIQTRTTILETRTINGTDYEPYPTTYGGTETVSVIATVYSTPTSTVLPPTTLPNQPVISRASAYLSSGSNITSVSISVTSTTLRPTSENATSNVALSTTSSSTLPSSNSASHSSGTAASIGTIFPTSPPSLNSTRTASGSVPPLTVPTQGPKYPVSSNSSIAPTGTATSSYGPIGTSLSEAGCPSINNTEYTLADTGDTYQIQCFREYSGPTVEGLQEPHTLNCMEVCSEVNRGFSNTTCYGITYQHLVTGNDCFLRTEAGLATYVTNQYAISAVLLTGVSDPVGVFGGTSRDVDPQPRGWKRLLSLG